MDAKIKAYGPRLYGLCMILCKNQQDAWDLYQDTWLRAYEKQTQYKENMSYEAWLTAICVNRYRDILRRIKVSPIFDAFATSDDKEAVFENKAAPQEEDFGDVREAVDKLPKKLREAVILFYFEDKDIKNVAAVLKIPEGTVKTRLMKARKLLKEVLKDEWNI